MPFFCHTSFFRPMPPTPEFYGPMPPTPKFYGPMQPTPKFQPMPPITAFTAGNGPMSTLKCNSGYKSKHNSIKSNDFSKK